MTGISNSVKEKAAKEWLAGNGSVTKTNVATKYGISVRTLGRAIDKLQKGESPVAVKQPKNKSGVKKKPKTKKKALKDKQPTPEVEAAVEPVVDDAPREISYIGTRNSITISDGFESIIIPVDDDRYIEVTEFIALGDVDAAWDAANTKKRISEFTSGRVEIKNGCVTISGVFVDNRCSERLLKLLEDGAPEEEIIKFCNFFERLSNHHDKRVVDELFDFLQHNSITLNDDGTFNAYKAVRADFKDCYTGKIDNSVGAEPYMPRALVDDDRDRTCSHGLHFASYNYAAFSYGTRGNQLVRVVVDPEDVVSIPSDYSGQKGRAYRYKVVEHIGTL